MNEDYDKQDLYYKELQADKALLVPSKLRLEQMALIDVYMKAAEEDDTIKGFMVNLAKKINKALIKLDVRHKEAE